MRTFVLIAAVPAALICEGLVHFLGTALGLGIFYALAVITIVIRQSYFAGPGDDGAIMAASGGDARPDVERSAHPAVADQTA